MIAKPFNDHFKFATDLTIIVKKSNASEIGPWLWYNHDSVYTIWNYFLITQVFIS